MLTFIARRLLVAIPILLGVSLVTFVFASLAPGDPISTLYAPGSGARPGELAALRDALGLDRPIHERYVVWLSQVLQGNFGYSYINNRSVAQTLLDHIPNTLSLTVTALIISVVAGVLLGIIAAYHHHGRIDRLLTATVFLGISVPSYLLALFAVFLFAVVLKVVPASGMRSAVVAGPELLDRFRHLVLPALVLAFGSAAIFMRYTRTSVLEVMRLDHVTTARSKGLPESTVRFRHVLRNALLPVVTIVGVSLPYLFTGALFVETMFSWPGIAKIAVDASLERDYPLIMGVALVSAVAIVLSNLLADISYAFADPPDQVPVSDRDLEPLVAGAGLPGLPPPMEPLPDPRLEVAPVEAGPASPGRVAWRHLRRNRLAMVSLVFLVMLSLAALLAPIIAPYDPYRPSASLVRKPPSAEHLLGTDASGRDVLSRLIHGARVSLAIGFASVAIYVVIGVIVGAVAGYRRGLLDGVVMRATDTVMAFPALIIIIAVVPILGPSIFNIMLVIGLLGWPIVARLVRGEFLSLREREFVMAARGMGATDRRLISRHLLPNVVGPLIVVASLGVAEAIIAEAGLSLLGLGVQPPDPSWGQMLSQAIDVGTLLRRPWLWVPPALAIALTVLAINFVGDGLRDALDPRHVVRGR